MQGIREAGATPQEFSTIAISSPLTKPFSFER